ncbi:hypothetical protein Lal_00026355 [Lupinus albus]|nr:hypothetical protein Lal_00026355 [Lupinus albus]
MHGSQSLSQGMVTNTMLLFTLFLLGLVFKLLFSLLPSLFLDLGNNKFEHSVRVAALHSMVAGTSSRIGGAGLGKLLAMFPILYLSAGTCTTLIIIGGTTARTFYEVCQTYDYYRMVLVFTCAAVVLSQLPNSNSIAGISLVGAVTAVGYCTSILAVS